MKFGQRHSIRKGLTPAEFGRGIWNPTLRLQRDIIEDYLYIARKRIDNKFAMFKLQLNILQDLVANTQTIDQYKELDLTVSEAENKGLLSREEAKHQRSHNASELFALNSLNRSLREIADGIAWKYFKYNRAILHMLADKEPIVAVRLDDGAINTLNEYADIFTKPDSLAILNDITNFLRVGDVTEIRDDGTIELIEVKSSKRRGSRITRQKQAMSELVNFFNTGMTDYDGKPLKIAESNLKLRTYLPLLNDSIKRVRNHGYDSLLIGNHLILNIADLSRGKTLDKAVHNFQSRHKSILDNWTKNKDFVVPSFFIDKMDYSKNCAPFSIYPFDVETCTDIMMGKIMIQCNFNFSEIFRLLKKAGWQVIDSLFLKSEEDLAQLKNKDVKDVSFLKVGKPPIIFDVPPAMLARMRYELLAPSTFIEHLESVYERSVVSGGDYYCIEHFVDDQRIWL